MPVEDHTPDLPPDPEPEPEAVYGVPDTEAEPVPPGLDVAPFATGTGKEKRKPEGEKRGRWPVFVVLGCLMIPCLCCILPLCGALAAGVTVGAILDNSKVVATGTDQVTVSPDAALTVEIDNPVGNVTIEPGAADAVTVSYTKKAYGLTKSKARQELEAISVQVTQPQDGLVRVSVEITDEDSNFFGVSNDVALVVAVPEGVGLVIQTRVSDVTVRDVTVSSLAVETSTGTITFAGDLEAGDGTFDLKANVGDIRVRLPLSADVIIDASTDVGSIDVSDAFSVTNHTADRDGPGQSWRGTLGQDSSAAPTLTLATDVGDIAITPR